MSIRAACRAAVLLLAGSAGFSACGGTGISHTVSDSYLKDMSVQGKLWIYDAENEVIVALDRLDEAKDKLVEIRRQIRDAEAAIKRTEKRNKPGAIQLAEGWLSYLELLQEWAEENVGLQRIGLVVARATVELAKAQVISREDLLGGKGFAVGDYKAQYDSAKKEFLAEEKRINKLRIKARGREKKWWKLRESYVAQSGDYESGLWID